MTLLRQRFYLKAVRNKDVAARVNSNELAAFATTLRGKSACYFPFFNCDYLCAP
jgi:hypothetical protein